MLEELLSTMPAVLIDKATGKRAWLTIGGLDDGVWGAAYLDKEGFPINGLDGRGYSAVEAVKDLLDIIHLQDIVSSPAIAVDELSGQLS